MKVLIAEDSRVLRTMLERQVLEWGYDPVLAEDGLQAWDILQRDEAPRLAILDWQMPGLDGIEVCRRVKKSDERPFTYVVMLTSRDAEDDMVAGLEAGADDYLTKPAQPAVLRSRLIAARRIVEVVPPKEWSKPRVPGYEVKRLLGKGAFATVWEAVQESTDRPVALKIIRVDLATDEVFSRFAREIELTENLNHPNIARVYDSHIDKKLAYCAMELIDGPTLEKYVARLKPKPKKVLELTAQVCDALEHAHQHGVLHRDLKPSNIMMTAEANPKLVDFGLGKSMFHADPEVETGQSLDGSVIGTPLFMAPEQARGENQKLDGRADIYALGTLLYVLLVRRHPHKINHSDRWETIREIAGGQARLLSEVRPGFDSGLEKIVMKALAEDPDDRYSSAAEFGEKVRQFIRERRRVKAKGS
ncbi:MAG: protein kinase domain-containing protein [Aeoliella sp.]